MSESIIKLENVNFWYDKGKPYQTEALKDVNIEIEQGEYVAFFGPSGSGKTTLLYLIAGVEPAQEGRIMIKGRDISKFSNQELAVYRQIGVGIIFQQFNLINTLTVLNNVALPMSFLGVSEKKRQEEAMKILERLGINDLKDRLPSELSGGQQQRVGIARALANNAPIIIADEPLGNLDSENSKKVLELLKELHEKDGRTIIMVTHEAWSLKDVEKVFYIKDGQVAKTEATPKGGLAESLTTQFEKRLTSETTETEKIAGMLANVLLRGFTNEEVVRFQMYVDQRLAGKIDSLDFFGILDKPFKDGGVGLWKQTAHKVLDYVEDIIKKRQEVLDICQELEKNNSVPITKEIINLRKWLLLEYHGDLDPNQLIKFDEILINRLRQIVTADDFKQVLNLSKNQSGLGLAMHTITRISEKLELALGARKQ